MSYSDKMCKNAYKIRKPFISIVWLANASIDLCCRSILVSKWTYENFNSQFQLLFLVMVSLRTFIK